LDGFLAPPPLSLSPILACTCLHIAASKLIWSHIFMEMMCYEILSRHSEGYMPRPLVAIPNKCPLLPHPAKEQNHTRHQKKLCKRIPKFTKDAFRVDICSDQRSFLCLQPNMLSVSACLCIFSCASVSCACVLLYMYVRVRMCVCVRVRLHVRVCVCTTA